MNNMEKKEIERGRREYARWEREYKKELEKTRRNDEYLDRKQNIAHIYRRVQRAQERGENISLSTLIKPEDRWILERIYEDGRKSEKSRHDNIENFSKNNLNAESVDLNTLLNETQSQVKKHGPEGEKFRVWRKGHKMGLPDNKNARYRVRTKGWNKDFKKLKNEAGKIGGRRKRRTKRRRKKCKTKKRRKRRRKKTKRRKR